MAKQAKICYIPMAKQAKISSLPTGCAELLGPAVAAFLIERDLAPSSHRVYALT